ncbi:MAG: hypothetical protein ABJ360_11170, partial [Roseobacter sp.]
MFIIPVAAPVTQAETGTRYLTSLSSTFLRAAQARFKVAGRARQSSVKTRCNCAKMVAKYLKGMKS